MNPWASIWFKPRQTIRCVVWITVGVAVLFLLAAIVLPNVMHMRVRANETVAIGNIRALVSSLEHQRSQTGTYLASSEWATVPVPTPFQVPELTSHDVQGYRYTYTSTGGTGYTITAVARGFAGWRSFYVDETGDIRHCTPTSIRGTVVADTAVIGDRPIEESPLPCRSRSSP